MTTYQDLSVGVAGLPMQVLRTYDSFDKAVGDFGVGWNVELANFHVSVNKPLGYGGWVQETFGCSFIFCQTRYHSTTPHTVTVVWPDGHQEIFDLTPANGSTFFAPLTAAGFTGRARTTSTLQDDGRQLAVVLRRRQPVRRRLRFGRHLRPAAVPADRQGRHGLRARSDQRASCPRPTGPATR